MQIPHLIGPRPASATSDSGFSRFRSCSIPYDLLQEGSRRLGILSLVVGSMWILATLGYHIAVPSPLQATDGIVLGSALLSLLLFFYTRRETNNPVFVLDLGLAYLMFMGAGLGAIGHWDYHSAITPMISWIGAMVLMFSAIVPAAPVKLLLAGFIAISMNPISMAIAKARGSWDFGSYNMILVMHWPDYLLLGVAVVISLVVTTLGRQVTKAREMGSYKLVKLLGKGGMGEVWQATHRMLTRDAAIKLIQPDLLNRVSQRDAVKMQRRFEQEAKATASLRSPHTVELYDFGVTDGGVLYYVMELLDGIDLSTLVKTYGPQPPARVAHILYQVCRSLADAHRHGMVHRDIKPTNIYLCRLGNEYDFAKVLDFGLVKLLDNHDGQMTEAGAATGTPAYMAPEVALGSESIDGQSDLYGLGCVAYWLLTGELVFAENSATAMMLAHVQKAPVPPSQRSGRAIPQTLEQAIMKCLAKKPTDRYASAETLAQALSIGEWTQTDAERWWIANVAEGPVPARHPETDPSALTQSISLPQKSLAR